MKPGVKLFPPTKLAVEAMALCCDDIDKSPVAPSEVYNETWMLRMMLSFIHDYYVDRIDNQCEELSRIASAVRRNWISEGGLRPVFEKEGPTWADAILGNIKLDDQGETKRGVVVDSDNDKDGVIVIEAKMNSALASGITHASDYNQVVRNIACLAQLVMGKELAKDSAFFVFAPQSKINVWINDWKLGPKYLCGEPEKCSEKVWEVINGQTRKIKEPSVCDKSECFKQAVKNIVANSKLISWESIIQSFNCDKRESLKNFYVKTCSEYKVETGLGKSEN